MNKIAVIDFTQNTYCRNSEIMVMGNNGKKEDFFGNIIKRGDEYLLKKNNVMTYISDKIRFMPFTAENFKQLFNRKFPIIIVVDSGEFIYCKSNLDVFNILRFIFPSTFGSRRLYKFELERYAKFYKLDVPQEYSQLINDFDIVDAYKDLEVELTIKDDDNGKYSIMDIYSDVLDDGIEREVSLSELYDSVPDGVIKITYKTNTLTVRLNMQKYLNDSDNKRKLDEFMDELEMLLDGSNIKLRKILEVI